MTRTEWLEQVAQVAFIMYGALSASPDENTRRVLDIVSEVLFMVPDKEPQP